VAQASTADYARKAEAKKMGKAMKAQGKAEGKKQGKAMKAKMKASGKAQGAKSR